MLVPRPVRLRDRLVAAQRALAEIAACLRMRREIDDPSCWEPVAVVPCRRDPAVVDRELRGALEPVLERVLAGELVRVPEPSRPTPRLAVLVTCLDPIERLLAPPLARLATRRCELVIALHPDARRGAPREGEHRLACGYVSFGPTETARCRRITCLLVEGERLVGCHVCPRPDGHAGRCRCGFDGAAVERVRVVSQHAHPA